MLINPAALVPIDNKVFIYGTRQEESDRLVTINALRKNTADIQLRKGLDAGALRQLVDSLKSELLLLFAPCRLSNRMCKNYGHVITTAEWKGKYPTCSDCGAEINSPQQLRKAIPGRRGINDIKTDNLPR
jgi:hypothetical protein